MRLYRLDYPNKYYFDEVYHAVTAKAYAVNNPAGYEWWHPAPEPDTAYEWLHPPVGKLMMAAGIAVFGPTAWAWRFPGVLFGVGIIWLTYWIGAKVSKKQLMGMMAAFFVSMDGLLIAQSRIGMNDIYVTFFMLAAIGSYVFSWQTYLEKPLISNKWLLVSSLMTGLAVSTKWSGIFVIGGIGIFELYRWHTMGKKWWGRVPRLMVAYLLMPVLIYILSFGQFWLQGHTLDQFKELHRQIWWYQTHLEATHPYQSQAWEWPLMLRPVWYFVDYLPDGKVINIYNLGNPMFFWFGLLAQIGLLLEIITVKKRKKLPSKFIWLSAYLVSWLPWAWSPRIMFSYHYAPAIPFLALGLANFCDDYLHFTWGKWMVWGIIGSIALCFIWFLPIWIGIPLTRPELDLRFILPTWQ